MEIKAHALLPTRYLRIILLAFGIYWSFPTTAFVVVSVTLVHFYFYRKNTKIVVADRCLYISKWGFLHRNACVESADITAVVVTRSAIDIIARTANLTFFTEAGAVCGKEAIRISISSENDLCYILGFAKSVRARKSSLLQTLWQALSTTSLVTGVAFLLPIMRKVDMLLNDSETTADKIEKIGETFFGLSPLMNLAATFVLIAFAVSLLLFVMRYVGYTSSFASNTVCVFFGLFPKTTIYMRKSAIDSTAAVQPPLLFLFKKVFVKADVAGLKNNKKREVYLSPPREQTKNSNIPLMRGKTWQYSKYSYCFFCFGVAILLSAHILFPALSDLITVLFSVMTVVVYYRFCLAKYAHHHTNIDLCVGNAHYVRGARVIQATFDLSKIGIIRITTFPYDRKKRLCTVKIILRSENATKIVTKFVSAERVHRQLKKFLKK